MKNGKSQYAYYSAYMDRMWGTLQSKLVSTGEMVHYTIASDSPNDNGGAKWDDIVLLGEIEGSPIKGRRGEESDLDDWLDEEHDRRVLDYEDNYLLN